MNQGPTIARGEVTRRQWLRFGGGAAIGLGSARRARGRKIGDPERARAVIVLLLEGGMSHLDTWDPKPGAPAEIRGEFGTIATANPALRVGEHMPALARVAHLYTVVRSVQSPARNHNSGLHLVLTGYDNPAADAGAVVRNTDYPCQGSVFAYHAGGRARGVPPFAVVPNRLVLGGENTLATAARLGAEYEPFETGEPSEDFDAPLPPPDGLALSVGLTPDRLSGRRALLKAIDELRRGVGSEPGASRMAAYRDGAFGLVDAGRLAGAFDLTVESEPLRRRYGAHQQGQACLLARRLVEAGVGYVLVNMAFSTGNAWDTHADNFQRLRQSLLPPMDQAVSALLEDLQARGLLDETIVLMMSEMGRTPVINKDAGRDHHPDAYSALVAGGGIVQGCVLGATSPTGQHVIERPVPVADLLATVNARLGIDSSIALAGDGGRPVTILPPGARAVGELLARGQASGAPRR